MGPTEYTAQTFSKKYPQKTNIFFWGFNYRTAKGLSSCRSVTVADRRKLGHFDVAVSLSQSFCLQKGVFTW